MRIKRQKRIGQPLWLDLAIPVGGLLMAFLASGVFLVMMGVSPIEAYREMYYSAFGDSYGLSECMVKAIPLAMTAIALMLSFKMLIWNIGAEGQIFMGAIAATAAVRYFPVEGHWTMMTIMGISAIIAGGIWAAFAGYLRARWNVNEIITTLMMNYIAIHLMDYFVYGPWRDPSSLGFPMTAPFPETAKLVPIGWGRVHSGIFIALALILLAWWVFKMTRWGYEIRVIGENPKAATFAGIDYVKNVVVVMFISGAIAGLAGMSEVAGLQGRLQHGFSGGFGYTAIIVAWLSRLNPLAIAIVSFLMGGLLVGGESLQIVMGLPIASTLVVQGCILFFILAGEFFRRYRIVLVKEEI
ncbi:inner-membrane translocator [Dethiosulfovibrio peptidovorans DSM 11002]|uniref:Inner-membrane translocator n=1 Tax=Dethiosulfovibrio peptidovorans DSM 11002 TaxID=469381 RepID=D2Z8N0_9BACT|nr:ABC transporter permease [Dethiosulfovibrio peptidovorans]EFC91827.1 inner-membrane translocator [Dethiosulfovibrio peptidovorans DSM 11002]